MTSKQIYVAFLVPSVTHYAQKAVYLPRQASDVPSKVKKFFWR